MSNRFHRFHHLVNDLLAAECVVDREAVEREEARRTREQRLYAAKAAITPEDALDIVTGRVGPSEALTAARRWHEAARGLRATKDGRPMRFLALLGQPGRGKTVAAAWLLAEVGGLYVSAPELGRLRASTYWRDQETFRTLFASRLVVVDDLGAEIASTAIEEAMFDLVNARQVDRAQTVLTGNITRQQLWDRYGERTVRRIEHQGAVIEITGPDMRRGARAIKAGE
jgi:DNA replication protein DnaC